MMFSAARSTFFRYVCRGGPCDGLQGFSECLPGSFLPLTVDIVIPGQLAWGLYLLKRGQHPGDYVRGAAHIYNFRGIVEEFNGDACETARTLAVVGTELGAMSG